MKKLICFASLLCLLLSSCSKDFLVPEGELPSWLGESIYEELKNPKSLDGTFTTYLRLIDDLGYKEVLSKTGSKTIFPANDAAFAAFFKDGNNRFGKSSYEQLTASEKSQILYSTMLDNAILIGNLSTQKNTAGEMAQGRIVKHPTNISLIQSVEPLKPEDMPANNPSFAEWKRLGKSINALYDDTEAPMVHFTGEYMLNNNMTVSGEGDNDFYILTGQRYNDGDAFIFNRKVVKSNVTCQNGYIHQLEAVVVNPGNMAQMLRKNSDTRHLSRMIDYFAVVRPMDKTFNDQYQQYAAGFATQDSVYAIRYLSQNSQRKKLHQRVQNGAIEDALLNFDPGWNYFNPTTSGTSDNQAEIAAILAPTDKVLEDYFEQAGAYIVKNLGDPTVPFTRENLDKHLDAIYNNDPSVIAGMLNNIMKPYLSKTVPSKFATVQNDAFEFLEVNKDHIVRSADSGYDVQIANNGVIYKVNNFFAPQLYNSVLGPASIYTDMRTMGKMLNDHQITPGTESELGADMYYYLLSMKARYALFVPTDGDDFYYIDPASVNSADGMRALRFIYDPLGESFDQKNRSKFGIYVQVCLYDEDKKTFTPDPTYDLAKVECKAFNSQIKDMLNYHTVVLDPSQTGLGGKHYYLTKHGGALYVPDMTGSEEHSSRIQGGEQMGLNSVRKSVVTQLFSENSADAKITNGTVYRVDFPVQPTVKSVYNTLSANTAYEDFLEFCEEFSNEERLEWCGVLSDTDTQALRKSKLSKYIIFGEGNIMAMLGTYNYTLYAPQNMKAAYDNGLPTWAEVDRIILDWESAGFSSEAEAKKVVKAYIDKMHDFVMYHIQNNSVFDDMVLNTSKNQTFKTDELGIASNVALDTEGGVTVVRGYDKNNLPYSHCSKLVDPNLLARDVTTERKSESSMVDVNGKQFSYDAIVSSSFVVVHGIDKPLCYNKEYKY